MRWQIYGVLTSLFVSLAGLGLIVWKVEPQTASPQVKVLFFVAIFILVWSMATVIIFSTKNRLIKSRALTNNAYEPIFYDSFFKGIVVAIAVLIFIFIKRFI